ncbi:sensor histidine kinase [Maricaulis sp.]|uniref:sensor histidine kinase n=1 Tax=Maricaulis sp. TaxID=1486257 RepID=UPI002B2684C2|nr:ATP-binding protein [Maricaulis sp.]
MHSILLTVLLDVLFAATSIAAIVYMFRNAQPLREAGAIRPVQVLTIGLLVWAAYHLVDASLLLFGPFFIDAARLPTTTAFIQTHLRGVADLVATAFLIVGFVWLLRRVVGILTGLKTSRDALEHELDGSSEREAELKVRAKNERAESQSRSEFMLGLSHELRTPLNGILGLSGLLSNTDLDPSQRKLLATMERSAQAMLARVTDVFDLARLENDKIELRSIAFQPSELARTVIGLFEPLAGEKGLQLTLEIGDDADLPVLGDPIRVRQVLNNLVSNAMKFTPAGSVAISVRLITNPSGKSWVEYQVTDTGVGIDAGLLERLSERSGRGSSGDSGLGLAICRRLSSLMDGDLTIESQVGSGTRVTVRLRVQVEPDDPDQD